MCNTCNLRIVILSMCGLFDDYFTGWTGTGLAEATTTVTIPAGSTGNKEYTATWEVAGTEFIKTTSTTFVEGARYIVCYDTNALKNNSGSISSSTVAPSNDTITTADETIMWTYSGGKFINDATGTTYYLKSTSSAVSLSTSSGGSISYTSSTSKLKIGSYYLRYNSGFVGSSSSNASEITLYIENSGIILGNPIGSPVDVNQINVEITGTLTSGSGNINYELYVNEIKKTTVTGSTGAQVTLTATELSASTTYNCYVMATAESDSSLTKMSNTISITTYACNGTGYTCTTSSCSGTSGDCLYCDGGSNACTDDFVFVENRVASLSECSCGTDDYYIYKCNSCNYSYYRCVNCNAINGSTSHGRIYCENCEGNGNLSCTAHGVYSAHRYCSHYNNTTLTTHSYCVHNLTTEHY